VVDDGSTDATAQIAAEFPVRVISTENRGLSHARNIGLSQARGEIVAYIDDDAYPDVHWLQYLAHTFATTDFVGVGGPNICPPDDEQIAQCVSHAPGGPNHVLLTDTIAEHIPGCNMAFRRDALNRAGGCDEHFRIAGDDVDLCWRLQQQGGQLGFSPAAMVWHHSRTSIAQYLRQQYNYGRAEGMLEDKWPSKYNSAGYPKWLGTVYGPGQREALRLTRSRVYHGVWGSNYFQSLYTSPPGMVASLALLPEWYLLTAVLGLVSIAGLAWPPLFWAIPLLLASSGLLAWQALSAARRADLPGPRQLQWGRWRRRGTIALLHLLQPVARLLGRSSFGLHPWRRRAKPKGFVFPKPRTGVEWSEDWKSSEDRLEDLDSRLQATRVRTRRGGPFDRWDIEVRGGLFGGVRILMTIEEHGQEKQLTRIKSWPITPPWMSPLILILLNLSLLALALNGAAAGIFLGAVMLVIGGRAFFDCATAAAVLKQSQAAPKEQETVLPDSSTGRQPSA
jgi:GT2 family glycosyltransferase